jgi:dihydrofolate reductase
MTAFVYSTATSLNGFIADESNSLDWLFAVGDVDEAPMAEFMRGVGVQVMGSTTYQWLLRHENLLEEPEKWGVFFGSIATRIVSSRDLPLPAGADARIIRGAVSEHIDDLVESAGGKDVWIVGGGDLAGQFLDAGRLDRVELSVAPVFLRGGAPLLPRLISSDRLHLVTVERNGSFARLVYEVVR